MVAMSETLKKKTAILLATYNGERYLQRQLDSLFTQTDRDWIVYAHDDGSTDGTKKILSDRHEKYPDDLKIIDGEPTGSACANFFYLMRNVEAEYFFFCDQDDIWEENKIELFRREMSRTESGNSAKPCMVFSDVSLINENGRQIAERMSVYQSLDMSRYGFNNLMLQNIVTGCAMMANRALVERALECKEPGRIIMHDYWMALVAAYFGRIACLDAATVRYRRHKDNTIGAERELSISYIRGKLGSARRSLCQRQEQMRVFVETFGLSEEKDPAACMCAHLFDMPKAKRLSFYSKYDVGKSGIIRRLGLLLCG